MLAGFGGVFTLALSEYRQSLAYRWLLGQLVVLLMLCLVGEARCALLSLAVARLSSSSQCKAGCFSQEKQKITKQ